MKIRQKILLVIAALATASTQIVHSNSNHYYWMKVRAEDKFARSLIADTGATIENAKEDYVIAYGSDLELKKIQSLGRLIAFSDLEEESKLKPLDFPTKDQAFHNYAELTNDLTQLTTENPTLVSMQSVGKTTEGRDIWVVRLGTDQSHAEQKPAIIYMGGHHAREHVSVEMPLMLAQYLITEYKNNNPRVVALLNSRDVHIIPAVNPDGMEYDIKDGKYKTWRKNRSRNSDGTFGVDLNRNYGYQWGTGGSSSNTSNETYKGTAPFSELETQAIKNYIDTHVNITTLLSFHTYSQLILYPWGHKYDSIEVTRDKSVHEVMAKKMAEWNGYTPEQASELYIASGDTTDWAYGVHKIISFTFELDPNSNSFGSGGFYPGASQIQPTFNKNIEPCLYLMEYSDNPYRVLNPTMRPLSQRHQNPR